MTPRLQARVGEAAHYQIKIAIPLWTAAGVPMRRTSVFEQFN